MNNIIFLYYFILSYHEIYKNEYYVYILLDPRKPMNLFYKINDCLNIELSHEPFYVGKGKGNRCLSHNYNKEDCNRYKKQKINHIKMENKEIIIVILKKDLYENESFKLEKECISIIKRKNKGGPLTNLTDGGEGSSGTIVSKETRIKHSNNMKGRKITWSDKISKSEKGKIVSKETRKKQSIILKEKYLKGELTHIIGKKPSETTKKLIGEKSKLMWENNYEKMKKATSNNLRNKTKESYDRFSEKMKKNYKVVNVITNETFFIKGLSKFCKENNMSLRHTLTCISKHKEKNGFIIERMDPPNNIK